MGDAGSRTTRRVRRQQIHQPVLRLVRRQESERSLWRRQEWKDGRRLGPASVKRVAKLLSLLASHCSLPP